MVTIERLRALEVAATPPAWSHDGVLEIAPLDADGQHDWSREIASVVSNRADAALIVAARNALPALLRVAEAAREVRAALHLNGVDTEAMRESLEGIEERLAAALAALDEVQP